MNAPKKTKKKTVLNTYVHICHEYNTFEQTCITTTTLKASSLEELDKLIDKWQNGSDWSKLEEAGLLKVKNKCPKHFFESGGFCSDDISFTCTTTGEDLKEWYTKQGWGTFKKLAYAK